LVERTPCRLRYLLTSTNQAGISVLTNQDSLPAPAGTIIGGVDLRFNAREAAESGSLGLPLLEAVGIPAANQGQARGLLLGGTLKVNAGGSIEAHIVLRTGVDVQGYWGLDADEGAAAGSAGSAGFAVLLIDPPDGVGNEAYLDIHFRRFKTR
jgi:hypothetical protein